MKLAKAFAIAMMVAFGAQAASAQTLKAAARYYGRLSCMIACSIDCLVGR